MSTLLSFCRQPAFNRLARLVAGAASFAVVVMAAAAVALAGAQTPRVGGELRIATSADVATFNPLVTSSITDHWVLDLMFPSLLSMDEEGRKVGYVADRWWYEDGGRTGVFHLKDGFTWDDGKPLTAEDVAFTARMSKEHNLGFTGSMLKDVESIEVRDPLTVAFHLRQPYGPFLSTVGFWMRLVPAHIWKSVDNPRTFSNEKDPVGAGPFRLVRYERGQYYELAARPFPLTPAGRPYVDRVIFRVYSDINTAILALRRGDVDAIASPVPAAALPQLRGARGITLAKTPSLGYVHMTYNTQNPHLSKAEVRRAIAHTVNKEAIRTIVLQGNAMPIAVPVSPVLKDWWDPTVKDYPFDIDEARRILTAAGYRDSNGDGFFDGLSFNLIYDQAHPDISRWVQMVKEDAAKAGIAINLQGMERNTYVAKARDGEYDIYAGGWGIMDEPPDYLALIFHSSNTFINFSRLKSPEMDAMIDRARYTGDFARMQEEVRKIQRYLHEQEYVTTLYVDIFNLAYNSDRFGGWKVLPSHLLGFVAPTALAGVYRK